MNLVLRTGADFWNGQENLETCFIAALDNLLTGLKENSIPDIFFAEVSLQQDY